MILNPGKCYSMLIGKGTHEKHVFYNDNLTLKNSNEEAILGVFIDSRDSLHILILIKGKQYALLQLNLR